MGGKIIVILFLVVALGIGLFLIRSGAIDQAVKGIGTLTKSNGSSTSIFGSLFPKSSPSPTGTQLVQGTPPPPPSYVQQASPPPPPPPAPQSTSTISPYEIPKGYTLKDLSPYFHKIRISSASAGSIYDYGTVSLYDSSYGNGSVPIDVSGWLLQARQGSQIVPQAIDSYDPSGLTAETDILMSGSDYLYIYTSQSATGKNLRMNKCIGYLEYANHFTPQLPINCPYVNRSELSGFTGQCQNYILSLGSCQLPDSNPPVPDYDYGCRAYLENINYKGCFAKYRSDSDFLSHEIRAWSGSRFLDPLHDKVVLFDKNNLVVDVYEY